MGLYGEMTADNHSIIKSSSDPAKGLTTLKILHTPFNIGNQASVLSRAEKKCLKETGSTDESVSVNFSNNCSLYPADKGYSAHCIYQKGPLGKVLNAVKIMLWGMLHVWEYDVIHFYFGRTFFSFGVKVGLFNHLDLCLLKLFGKKVFMTYQGCDVRQRTKSMSETVSACKSDECSHGWCSARTDAIRRRNISKVCRYADKVFCVNPDLIPFVPNSEFLPYAPLFLEDIEAFKPGGKRSSGRLRILHAPTDRAIKGTKYIEPVIDSLKKCHDIELVLLENISQAKLFAEYRKGDILIDQVLVGWYGAAAVEAMAFGLPVIAYINPAFLKYIPPAMADELPIVSASPTTLEDETEKIISSSELRSDLSRRGIQFVKKWHNPEKIAQTMLQLYKNPFASFWGLWEEGDR